jgi:hypothetical protein
MFAGPFKLVLKKYVRAKDYHTYTVHTPTPGQRSFYIGERGLDMLLIVAISVSNTPSCNNR